MAGYLVIGLGTFGRSIAQTLYENGKMVLAIDQQEERVQKVIDDEIEYFTCLANITVGDKEYLICENESGIKRVFYYDVSEEELVTLDEDEEDHILEIWDEDYYGTDKDYMYWNEDFGEYDKVKDETNLEDLSAEPFNDLDDDIADFSSDEDEEDLDDFLNEFLE